LDRLSNLAIVHAARRHPDNAARPLSVISRWRALKPFSVRGFAAIAFCALNSRFEIKTARARNVLPAKIDRAAAVESAQTPVPYSRVYLAQLRKSSWKFVDYLHQPFRQKLIPFLPRVISRARKSRPACVS